MTLCVISDLETFSFQIKFTIIFCTKTVTKQFQHITKKLKLNKTEWKIVYWLYLTLVKE